MALAIILQGTYLILIGLTPGHLSSGISQQATKGNNMAESTITVDRQRATEDSESHKLAEASPKEVHILCHA